MMGSYITNITPPKGHQKEESSMLPVETAKFLTLNHGMPCPAEILIGDGSNRRYLRKLSVGAVGQQEVSYEEVPLYFDRRLKVSSLVSFVAAAAEYSRRYSPNPGGPDATCVFSPKGGKFFPSADTRTFVTYERRNHPAVAVLDSLQQKNAHETFCLLLDRVRPFVLDYSALRAALRRISFNKNVTMVSQPRLIDGKSKQEFAVEFSVAGALPGEPVAVPASVEIHVPFTLDPDSPVLRAEMEIDITFDDQKKTSTWQCVWPTASLEYTRAHAAEIAGFTEAITAAGYRPLIVEDMG